MESIGDERRPGDVVLPHYTMGHDTLLDVTVINEIHQDLFPGAAEEPKHAVWHAYSPNWRKYSETCEAEGLCFIPLPVD